MSGQTALGIDAGVAAVAIFAAWQGTSSQYHASSRRERSSYPRHGRAASQQMYSGGAGMGRLQAGAFKLEDARQLLIAGLRNAHGLEQQAIEMLKRNAERIEHYPQLKARISQHLEESHHQQELVRQALGMLGESPSTIKDAVTGLAENAQMMAHAVAGDEVLKNLYTGYAFEHFEIASYRALIVMARAAGERRIEQIAERILREEEAMANWLAQHLPEVVNQYLVQMGSGQAKR